MNDSLTETFNKLSLVGKTMLWSAALGTSLSGIIRDDTKEHPIHYPLYGLYFCCALIPIPGSHIVPSLLLTAWIYSGATPWARVAKTRMKSDFNPAVLIERNKEFVVPAGAGNSGVLSVKGGPLAWQATKTIFNDSKVATKSFLAHIFPH